MSINSALSNLNSSIGSAYNRAVSGGSATNVINYDPNADSLSNQIAYANNNNSASAYESFLANKFVAEREDTAIQRAVADAEKAGISKYQLFQSGNAAAASPASAASGASTSYENKLNRSTEMKKAVLQAATSIITSLFSSAAKIAK